MICKQRREMKLRKLWTGAGGSEIAEAALVLPLMFTLLLGIYWFGRAYNVYATLNFAARDAARAGAAPSCAVCSNSSPTLATLAGIVQQDLQAAKIDPSLIQHPTPPPSPPRGMSSWVSCSGAAVSCPTISGADICVYQNVYIDNVTVDTDLQSCGVSVSFQYPYQMSLPFTSLNMTTVNLKAVAQMALEN